MPDDMTDSSKRLKKALGGISTSEMKAVRATVKEEIAEAKRPISSPPNTLASGASVRPAGDLEDLEKAGKIADNFMVGLDSMADVLMLLVMKFGRAAQLVRLLLLAIILGIVLLAVNLLASWHLSTIQEEIQEKQSKIQEQQSQILDRQKSTERVAGEAKVIAAAAEKTATQVKDSAPSVVVDAKGRPQLILKVQEGETTKTVDPKRSTLKRDGNDGRNLETPLTF